MKLIVVLLTFDSLKKLLWMKSNKLKNDRLEMGTASLWTAAAMNPGGVTENLTSLTFSKVCQVERDTGPLTLLSLKSPATHRPHPHHPIHPSIPPVCSPHQLLLLLYLPPKVHPSR